ncbi:MAG: outer membrane beta-barrel protein [Planctomycetota bacterium]|jgi:hypothetical protein
MLTVALLSAGLLTESPAWLQAPPAAPAPLAASASSSLVAGLNLDEAPQIAEPFNYNYVQGGLAFGDGEGFRLEGSYRSAGSQLFYIGHADLLELDGDVDLTAFSAGAGYIFPQDESLEFYATGELQMAEVEASAGGFSASDDEFGLRLAGGARYWVTPSEIELNAELVYTTVFDGDFSIIGGGLYHFNEQASAFAELELGDDVTNFTLGARWAF